MKSWKKFAVVLLALVTVFCVATFAACDFGAFLPPPEQGPGAPDNPDGGDETGGDETDDETGKLNLDAVIDGIMPQSLDYLDGSFTLNMSLSGEHTDGDASVALTGKAKFNGADGDADVATKEIYSEEGSEPFNQTHLYHSFLRGWKVYLYGAKENEEDILNRYEDGCLEDYGDVKEYFAPIKPELLVKYAPRHNYTLLMLAKETGFVKIEGDKLVVDVNGTIAAMKTVIDTFLDNAKSTDTIGEVLTNPLVANYFKAVLNIVDPEDLPEILSWLYFLDEEEQGLIDALMEVPADEGSTTYEYLLKLIKSNEAYVAAKDYIAKTFDASLPSKIENVTLQFVADVVVDEKNTDFAEFISNVKEMFDDLFLEVTDKKVAIKEKYYSQFYELSDTKIVYTIKDDKIVSQDVSGKYRNIEYGGRTEERVNEDGETCLVFVEDISIINYGLEYEFTGTINYPAEGYTPATIPTESAT